MSSELRRALEREIAARGPLPFSRYLELCLYHPEFGYYQQAREQFGKAGDFYTASDVHAVYGRLLARQFDEMWRALGAPARIEIVELGPGRGLFAQDVLAWSSEILVVMPCGYHLEKVIALAAKLRTLPGWWDLPAVRNRQVYAVDASSYFARPGPRVVEGTELLAHLIHPEAFSWQGPQCAYQRLDLELAS